MWQSKLELSSLASTHRNALSAHLLCLSAEDRYERFDANLRNEALPQWIAGIDWQQQRWWGAWFPQTRVLVGSLQLVPTPEPGTWDIGLTVIEGLRRQGIGTMLLATAMAHMPALRHLTGHCGHPAITAIGERLGFETVAEAQIPRVEFSLVRRSTCV